MSLAVAAAITRMVARGFSVEEASEIVSAVYVDGVNSAPFRNAAIDEAAQRRREKDRLRKRNVRGNPQTNADSSDVNMSAEIRGNPQTSAEFHVSPLSIEKKKEKRERGTRLPADWQPSDEERAIAKQQGLSDVQLDREAIKYRNHFVAAPGAKGVKLNWKATWQNWCVRAAEYLGCVPVAGKDPPAEPQAYITTTEEWFELLRKRQAAAQ